MTHSVKKLKRAASVSTLLCTFAAVGCSAGAPSAEGENKSGSKSDPNNQNIDTTMSGGSDVNTGPYDPKMDEPAPPGCGDGTLTDDEACDDGNTEGGDGCYANCLGVDRGFLCATPNEPCQRFAICGDGVAALPEHCDDKNTVDGDGCSSQCKLELGFKCDARADGVSVCATTTCGDGIVEGTEKCEGGATAGCTKDCQFIPKCDESGKCESECGDGLLLGEACDDGNLINGDGCSDLCVVENGYECVGEKTSGECEKVATPDGKDTCVLRVPVVFRDFSQTHSDFSDVNSNCGKNLPSEKSITTDLVENTLVNGLPVQKTFNTKICNENFADWYVDKPGTNVTHSSEMVLYDDGNGNYVNRWGPKGELWFTNTGWAGDQNCVLMPCGPYSGNPFFFPLDGAGALDDGGSVAEVSTGVAYGMDGSLHTEKALTGKSTLHNFGFTSAVSYLFTYTSSMKATLEFIGDDDLYVFIGGKLALDLGGLHATALGTIYLANGRIKAVTPPVTRFDSEHITVDKTAAEFGLTDNGVYDIKIFHAERKPTGSTFKLTLSGFETRRSVCRSECGDGVVAFGEQCDDGVNDGGYNECGQDCKLGSYCGDGVVDEGESCDGGPLNSDPDCIACRKLIIL